MSAAHDPAGDIPAIDWQERLLRDAEPEVRERAAERRAALEGAHG